LLEWADERWRLDLLSVELLEYVVLRHCWWGLLVCLGENTSVEQSESRVLVWLSGARGAKLL
jgi:hypothetical protein